VSLNLIPLIEEATPPPTGGIDIIIATLLETPQGALTLGVALFGAILMRVGFFKSLLTQIADEHPENGRANDPSAQVVESPSPILNGNTSKALELALNITQAREKALAEINDLRHQLSCTQELLEAEREASRRLADRVLILESHIERMKLVCPECGKLNGDESAVETGE